MYIPKEAQRRHIGQDGVHLYILHENEHLNDHGRLYARITIDPGCSIKWHEHEGEMESFYVLEGECVFDDNGVECPAKPGDLLYTPHGSGHAVHNRSNAPVDVMALVIFN